MSPGDPRDEGWSSSKPPDAPDDGFDGVWIQRMEYRVRSGAVRVWSRRYGFRRKAVEMADSERVVPPNSIKGGSPPHLSARVPTQEGEKPAKVAKKAPSVGPGPAPRPSEVEKSG